MRQVALGREAGYDGYVSTADSTRQDTRAVSFRRLDIGNDDVAVLSFSVGPNTTEALTAAERGVVQLALEGLSNKEIAARRGTATKTVANQLRRIYQKLGVTSRFELAARLGG